MRPHVPARRLGPASCWFLVLVVLSPCLELNAQAPRAVPAPGVSTESGSLSDAPSPPPAQNATSIADAAGGAVKTIGRDEWDFIKAPFQKKALIWDGLFLATTGVLIANDESVMSQVPLSSHSSGVNISNAGVYGVSAVAGGIYLTGFFTKNAHSQEVGIRTAEATVDSVILYESMKVIFQRQRPYTGDGEGKFFSGNLSNGSFPSGHSTFAWTIASSVAHQYHSIPLDIALYGIAGTVSVTRVTAGQHFPSDVWVGSILGYLIGDYVAHKQEKVGPIRGRKLERVGSAVLGHMQIGAE